MSDAVVIFHPADREALLPFLDLDEDDEDDDADAGAGPNEEEEESDGIYAEELEDGSFLLYTFQPFSVFAENESEAHAWLAQFGDDLSKVHDDPRGVLFFPDTVEPDAQTYEGVLDEAADEGIFVIPTASPLGAAIAGIDPKLLQALADQLLGGGGAGGGPGSPGAPLPFDIGKLVEGFQGQLLASLGAQAGQDENGENGGDGGDGDDVDEENDKDHEPSSKPPPKPNPKPNPKT